MCGTGDALKKEERESAREREQPVLLTAADCCRAPREVARHLHARAHGAKRARSTHAFCACTTPANPPSYALHAALAEETTVLLFTHAQSTCVLARRGGGPILQCVVRRRTVGNGRLVCLLLCSRCCCRCCCCRCCWLVVCLSCDGGTCEREGKCCLTVDVTLIRARGAGEKKTGLRRARESRDEEEEKAGKRQAVCRAKQNRRRTRMYNGTPPPYGLGKTGASRRERERRMSSGPRLRQRAGAVRATRVVRSARRATSAPPTTTLQRQEGVRTALRVVQQHTQEASVQ